MPKSPRPIAFALLAYAFAAIMVGTTMPTPMYALYAGEMHFAVLTTTIIFAAYAIGVLFALLVFGRWSDVLGRRPMLLAGVGFALASAAVFLVADSVPVLVVGRVLSGLSAGVFTGTATAAVIEAAPPAWRTRAAAVATVANIGGLGTGPLLAGLLVQYAPYPLHLSFVVHIALAVLAGIAVFLVPETSARTGKLGFQRLSVPADMRRVFLISALAGFAGFAVLGIYTSVAPSFLANVIGVDNHAAAGAVVASLFAASAITQLLANRIPTGRAVAMGCALLIAGVAVLSAALYFSSLTGLLVAAVITGVGQGMSFSRGLAAIAERVPAERRAEVNSTYFVVAYIAISIPVVSVGLAAQHWGLRTAGVTFSIAIAVLAVICLIAILVEESRAKTDLTTDLSAST